MIIKVDAADPIALAAHLNALETADAQGLVDGAAEDDGPTVGRTEVTADAKGAAGIRDGELAIGE